MIQLHDLEFVPFISSEEIKNRVVELTKKIAEDYKGETPVFLGILNGSYQFLASLTSHYKANCEVEFTKLSSYQGIHTTACVRQLIGVENLKNKDIIIVEDIVDTGKTLVSIVENLKALEVKSYRVATLFHKPEAYQQNIKLDYVGFEIPNKFIVGYGLDYDGLGRNLSEIYQLKH